MRLGRAPSPSSGWVSSSSATSSSTAHGGAGTRSTRGRRRRTCRQQTPSAQTCGKCSSRRARSLGIPVRDGGTVIVIQGPRFSTRAESAWYQSIESATVINMTAYPESHLARELELCYATIAMVTDHDVGVVGDRARLQRDRAPCVQREQREAPGAALRGDPENRPQPDDVCANALHGARI